MWAENGWDQPLPHFSQMSDGLLRWPVSWLSHIFETAFSEKKIGINCVQCCMVVVRTYIELESSSYGTSVLWSSTQQSVYHYILPFTVLYSEMPVLVESLLNSVNPEDQISVKTLKKGKWFIFYQRIILYLNVVKPGNGWFGHKNVSKYGFLGKNPYFESFPGLTTFI